MVSHLSGWLLGKGVPRLTQDRGNDPDNHHQAGGNIGCCPPWREQGGPDICDLSPVKSQRQHPKTRRNTKLQRSAKGPSKTKELATYKIRHNHILGSEPGHHIKVAEGWHQQARYKVPDKGASPYKNEEFVSGDAPSVGLLIGRLVHGGKHGSGHESPWPNHGRRPNQEASSQASKCITQDLGGNDEQQLI